MVLHCARQIFEPQGLTVLAQSLLTKPQDASEETAMGGENEETRHEARFKDKLVAECKDKSPHGNV